MEAQADQLTWVAWRAIVGTQKKLYFSTIVDDNEYSLTVKLLKSEKEVCFDRADVLKICLRYNYVLVRADYAKSRGLA